jgi:hypothetical protein
MENFKQEETPKQTEEQKLKEILKSLGGKVVKQEYADPRTDQVNNREVTTVAVDLQFDSTESVTEALRLFEENNFGTFILLC